MVYEMDAATMRHLVDAKVESQLTRAMRYVESINARAIVPSAGPPCFLDDALFHLNIVIDGDEPRPGSEHLRRPAHVPRPPRSVRPPRACWPSPAPRSTSTPDAITVSHPIPEPTSWRSSSARASTSRRTRPTGRAGCGDLHARWRAQPETDLVATLQEWWEPLLAACPTVREGIGCGGADPGSVSVEILVDFPAGRVRPYAGEEYGFRFDIERSLVEQVVAERAVDWSNSLFLSCRFTAWRAGEFNEYVYNFLKSLSAGRMRRTEAEALRKLHPPTETEPDIELDGWVDAAPLPAPQRRPQRVRRGRRLRARLHAARLALRPRDRPLPHQRRPPPEMRSERRRNDGPVRTALWKPGSG